MQGLYWCYDDQHRLYEAKTRTRAELLAYFQWLEAHRIVKQTRFYHRKVLLSTVFLGINHNFIFEGPPVVFETMIFGGNHDERQWRYTDYDAARIHHDILSEELRKQYAYQIKPVRIEKRKKSYGKRNGRQDSAGIHGRLWSLAR